MYLAIIENYNVFGGGVDVSWFPPGNVPISQYRVYSPQFGTVYTTGTSVTFSPTTVGQYYSAYIYAISTTGIEGPGSFIDLFNWGY